MEEVYDILMGVENDILLKLKESVIQGLLLGGLIEYIYDD